MEIVLKEPWEVNCLRRKIDKGNQFAVINFWGFYLKLKRCYQGWCTHVSLKHGFIITPTFENKLNNNLKIKKKAIKEIILLMETKKNKESQLLTNVTVA